jgi:hypothetical protein
MQRYLLANMPVVVVPELDAELDVIMGSMQSAVGELAARGPLPTLSTDSFMELLLQDSGMDPEASDAPMQTAFAALQDEWVAHATMTLPLSPASPVNSNMQGPIDAVHTRMEPGLCAVPLFHEQRGLSDLSLVFQIDPLDIQPFWPTHSRSRSPTGIEHSTEVDQDMEDVENVQNANSILAEPEPTTPLYEDFGQYGRPVSNEDSVEYYDDASSWFAARCDDWMQDTPTYE